MLQEDTRKQETTARPQVDHRAIKLWSLMALMVISGIDRIHQNSQGEAYENDEVLAMSGAARRELQRITMNCWQLLAIFGNVVI